MNKSKQKHSVEKIGKSVVSISGGASLENLVTNYVNSNRQYLWKRIRQNVVIRALESINSKGANYLSKRAGVQQIEDLIYKILKEETMAPKDSGASGTGKQLLKQLEQAQKKYKKYKYGWVEAQKKLVAAEGVSKMLTQKLQRQRSLKKMKVKSNDDANTQRQNLKVALAQLKVKEGNLRQTIGFLVGERNTIEEKMNCNVAVLMGEISELKSQIKRLKRQNTGSIKKQQLQEREVMIRSLLKQKIAKMQETSDLNRQLKIKEEQIMKIKKDLNEVMKNYVMIQRQNEHLKSGWHNLEEKLQTQDKQLENQSSKLIEVTKEKESLKAYQQQKQLNLMNRQRQLIQLILAIRKKGVNCLQNKCIEQELLDVTCVSQEEEDSVTLNISHEEICQTLAQIDLIMDQIHTQLQFQRDKIQQIEKREEINERINAQRIKTLEAELDFHQNTIAQNESQESLQQYTSVSTQTFIKSKQSIENQSLKAQNSKLTLAINQKQQLVQSLHQNINQLQQSNKILQYQQQQKDQKNIELENLVVQYANFISMGYNSAFDIYSYLLLEKSELMQQFADFEANFAEKLRQNEILTKLLETNEKTMSQLHNKLSTQNEKVLNLQDLIHKTKSLTSDKQTIQSLSNELEEMKIINVKLMEQNNSLKSINTELEDTIEYANSLFSTSANTYQPTSTTTISKKHFNKNTQPFHSNGFNTTTDSSRTSSTHMSSCERERERDFISEKSEGDQLNYKYDTIKITKYGQCEDEDSQTETNGFMVNNMAVIRLLVEFVNRQNKEDKKMSALATLLDMLQAPSQLSNKVKQWMKVTWRIQDMPTPSPSPFPQNQHAMIHPDDNLQERLFKYFTD